MFFIYISLPFSIFTFTFTFILNFQFSISILLFFIFNFHIFIYISNFHFHNKYKKVFSAQRCHEKLQNPKSKFSEKEKYIPTEISPLSEKTKSLGIGLKLVRISNPKVLPTDTHTHRLSQILAQLKLRIEN